MERDVDCGPPTKKPKPFRVLDAEADAWNIVDPDNLNAELPDELRNISLAQSIPMQRKNTLLATSNITNFFGKCDFTVSGAGKMDASPADHFNDELRLQPQKDFSASRLHESDDLQLFSRENYIHAGSVQLGSHQSFQNSLQIQHVSDSQQQQQKQQIFQLQLQVIQDQHVEHHQQSNHNQQNVCLTGNVSQKYHVVSEVQPLAVVQQQPLSLSQQITTKPTLAIAPQRDSTISGLLQRRRLIQKQLVLLLHANKCQKKTAKSDGSDLFACNIPYCQTMKEVLKHLVTCQQEKSCKVPYCASSRQLINHWKDCSNVQCMVCSPLKLACEKKSASTVMAASVAATTDTVSMFNLFSTSSHVQHHQQPACSELLVSQQMPKVQEVMRNQESNILRPASQVRSISTLTLDNNDWHSEVGRESRNNAVYKLVKFLRPACQTVGVNDLTRIILFVKQLEKASYERAMSKEQYCQMLSTRIYAIKKKLEEPSFAGTLESLCVFDDAYDANQNVLSCIIENQQTSLTSDQNFENYSNDLKTSTLEITSSNVVPSNQDNVFISLHSNVQTIKGEPLVPSVCSDMANSNNLKINFESATTLSTEMVVDSSSDAVPLSSCKLVWKKDEMKKFFFPILQELYHLEPESFPFRKPVDPELEGVPDYLNIIKNPMDLSTIQEKLDNGLYQEPWQLIDDVWLMFENAWTFNKKGSRVHRYSNKLSEVFDSRVDSLMRKLGFCCGQKRMYTPIVLICYGKYMCTVPINTNYYTYQNKFSYCEKCFNNITGDYIELNEDPSQPATKLSKSYFVKCKNGEFEYEELTECIYCGRRHHAICCLHMEQIWPNRFICHTCIANQRLEKVENKFTAKRLPQTRLSIYLESRVNSFLKKNSMSLDLITIRVLSSFEKSVDVKPGMKSRYHVEGKNVSSGFPYVAKGIFAFMESDGVDVCFFGMHVQEYDSNCSAPNSRRVYLAYMDSVNFFRPRHLRTLVYHELLIGYLDYVKKLGYAHAHIWACPPSEGDDYIFNCHPPDMKIPKQRRLQDWYRKLLDKALLENVIFEYKDFYKDAIDNGLKSVTEMPYFEGDYWPSILEEFIKEAEEEEEEEEEETKIQKECDVDLLEIDNAIQEPGKPISIQCHSRKKNQKGSNPKKRNCKSRYVRKAIKKSNTGFSDLASRLLTSIERLKDGFFVVNFHPPQMRGMLPEIKDPDQFINTDLMDGRDSFLSLARDKHYEFSSLRRAKYSTMALLYELHTQGKDGFVYTCNICKTAMEGHYHCYICNDFDLCESCYKKEGHSHEMGKLGGPDDGKENMKEAKTVAIQNKIIALSHASQCLDANCELVNCRRMKLSMQHVRHCKQKVENNCKGCRHFFALCCYHAKRCHEVKCMFPLCKAIKQKHVLQKRLQAQMLRRRMAALHSSREFPSAPDGNPARVGSSIGRDIEKSDKERFVDQSDEHVISSLQQQEHSVSDAMVSNITSRAVEMTTAGIGSTPCNKDDIVQQQFHFQNSSVPFIRNDQLLPSSSATQNTLLLLNTNVNQPSLSVDLNHTTNNNHNALLPSSSQPAFIIQLQPQLSLLTSPQGHVLGVVQHSQVAHKVGQQLVLQQSFNAPQQLLMAPQLASNQTETSVNLSNISQHLPGSNVLEKAPQMSQSAQHLLLQSNSSNETQLVQAPAVIHQQVCNPSTSLLNSTASVPKASSAIVKLFETLKSSPLPQHQQLLNILIKDPLKLAQVIRQKRAAKEVSNTQTNEQLQYSANATKPSTSASGHNNATKPSTSASGHKVLTATDHSSAFFLSSENPTQILKQPIIFSSDNSFIINDGSDSHVTAFNSDQLKSVSQESIMRIGSRNFNDNKVAWFNNNPMITTNNTAVNSVSQMKLNETTLSQELLRYHTFSSPNIPGISQSRAPALIGSSDEVLTSGTLVNRVLPSQTISNVNHLAPIQCSLSSDFQRLPHTNSCRSINSVPKDIYHISNQDLLKSSQSMSKVVLAHQDFKFMFNSSPLVKNLNVQNVNAETSSQFELSSSTFHRDILSKLVSENLNGTAVKNIMLSSPAAQIGYPSFVDLTSLDQKDLIENVLDISPQDQLSQYADQL